MSDARRLQGSEQARAHRNEEPAEAPMELVLPAGQDMATKSDIDLAVVTPLCRGRLGLCFTG